MKYVLLFLCLYSLPIAAQQKFSVFFDFNMDVPNSISLVRLNDWVRQNPDVEIVKLSGHADSIDFSSYNKELSSRRIKSVLNLLRNQGIAVAETVALDPLGEDFQQSANQAENRRVEVVYRKITLDNSVLPNADDSAIDPKELVPDALSAKVKSQFTKASKGDLIRINNINFYLNSEKVVAESEPVLLDLYQTMADNPGLRIEIHGHICCNRNIRDTRLSYRRAKYIFTYLLDKGISLNRLGYKGFGSANPIYPIPENNPGEERANRRVEILIVETNVRR